MGRIKNAQIKTKAEDLIMEDPNKFTDNFQTNKEILKEMGEFSSKKTRNVVAGYITRLMKKIEEEGY